MDKSSSHSRLSTAAMRELAENSADSPVIINLTGDRIVFTPTGRRRMEQVLRETGAAMVYADYMTPSADNADSFVTHQLIDCQPGRCATISTSARPLWSTAACSARLSAKCPQTMRPPDGMICACDSHAWAKSPTSWSLSTQPLKTEATIALQARPSSDMSTHATAHRRLRWNARLPTISARQEPSSTATQSQGLMSAKVFSRSRHR